MFYPVLLHRQGTLEDEVAEPEMRGADKYHKSKKVTYTTKTPMAIICVKFKYICNVELSRFCFQG